MNNIKAKRLLKDNQKFHSEFQIYYFIIGSQGDAWAQYKQCLREIQSRVESIESDEAQLELLKLNSKRRFYLPTRLNRKKRELAKIAHEKQIKSLIDTINDRQRELNCFVEIAEDLKKEIGPITCETTRQLEAQSWENKGRKMIAMDRLMGGLRPQTIEFVLSLPNASQFLIEMMDKDFNPEKLINEVTK